MTAKMSVSVYMPTHNRPSLLKRAIKSVQLQTYPVDELIVVDDGSSDDTWNVLQELKKTNPKLIAIKHEHPKGACAARNTAIAAASGTFITGLDDDDEFLPEHIEGLVKHWDPDYACVVASMLNDNGSSRVPQGKEYGTITLAQLLHYNRLGNQVFTLTERLRGISGFDEQLPAFQDYDCWVRLLEKYGDAVKLADHTYVLHTAHELNRISNNNSKRLKALSLFVEKHQGKMSSQHLRSAELIRKRISNEPVGLSDVFKFINLDNYRAVISAFLTSLKSESSKQSR